MEMMDVYCEEHKGNAEFCQQLEHAAKTKKTCQCGRELVGIVSKTNGLTNTMFGCPHCDFDGADEGR